jgi:hypothetical protein
MQESQWPTRQAFALFMPTIFQGIMPAWYDEESGNPVTYATEHEAQREIADHHLELIKQFLVGERDFAEAMTVEDVILPVRVWPDGSVSIEDGRIFGRQGYKLRPL